MKKILLIIFLLFTFNIYSYPPAVEENMEYLKLLYYKHRWEEAVDELSDLIEDDEIPNIEKIHYIWTRANIYSTLFKDAKNYLKDIRLLRVIMKYDEECARAMWEYYQYK